MSGCTSGLHAYSQGKLNYLGSSSEKTWPPALAVLFPQSYCSTEEIELRGRLKIQKCRLSTATSKVAFLGGWWWWWNVSEQPYWECPGHSGVSPSGLAWLPSTPASLPSQARLLSHVSPSSSLSVACFYQRGVELRVGLELKQPRRKIKEFCAVFPLASLLMEKLRPPPLPFFQYYQNGLRELADEMVYPCNSLSLV